LLMSACQGLGGGSSPTPTPTPPAGSLNSINHIVLFMQENRSFDTYFGQLNAFRAKQTPALPQDVDTWSSGTDKTPTNVSTPSYDPNTGLPGPPIKAFHMQSACSENLTPSWNETHRIFDLFRTPGAFPMDGYAFVEGKFAHDEFVAGLPNFTDFTGKRAMGFYDDTDLPFLTSWQQTSPPQIAGFLLRPRARIQTAFTGWQPRRKASFRLRTIR